MKTLGLLLATAVGATRGGSGQQYAGLVESFYLGQNDRGWIVSYYDDECWMALALLRAFDLTTEPKYLNQAKALFADIQTGWDTTCCGANKGGMWWDKRHTQKATAANDVGIDALYPPRKQKSPRDYRALVHFGISARWLQLYLQ